MTLSEVIIVAKVDRLPLGVLQTKLLKATAHKTMRCFRSFANIMNSDCIDSGSNKSIDKNRTVHVLT